MALEQYIPTVWRNGTKPSINGANLNHLEAGVFNVTQAVLEMGSPSVSWGSITGDLNAQVDLKSELDKKALVIHTHQIDEVVGLQQTLDKKSDIGHTHKVEDVLYLQDQLDAKEQYLGIPSASGYVLSSDTNGVRTWIDIGSSNSVPWGNITGDILNQVDLQNQFSTKASISHGHNISDVTDLQTELDNKADVSHNHDSDYFNMSEFVEVSSGTTDAGKPIVLSGDGKLDPSLFDSTTAFTYQGPFTPQTGSEYPDTSGVPTGSIWTIDGVDDVDGFTFTEGNLVGQTAFNNDYLIFGHSTGFDLREATVLEPTEYYKTDGSNPLVSDFNCGGYNITNVTDVVDFNSLPNTYGATIGQLKRLNADDVGAAWEHHGHTISSVEGLQLSLDNKSNVGHNHSISDVTNLQTELDSKAPLSHNHSIGDITDLQNELDNKISVDGSIPMQGTLNLNSNSIVGLVDELDYESLTNDTSVTIGQLKRLNADDVGAAWETHGHTISSVEGLQLELDSKQNDLGLGTSGQVLYTNTSEDGTEWGDLPSQDIVEAPEDGNIYGRQDASWVTVPSMSHTHTEADISDLDKYTQSEVDTRLSVKVGTDSDLLPTVPNVAQIITCTQAEYDGLTPDSNTLYIIVG